MDPLPSGTLIHCSCDETLQRVRQSLSQSGLRTLETFDLHDARHGVADCACPYHGMEECDCQMIVMMIYGAGMTPVTLTLHGSNGQTWIFLADEPAHDRGGPIQAALEKAIGEIVH